MVNGDKTQEFRPEKGLSQTMEYEVNECFVEHQIPKSVQQKLLFNNIL